MRRRSPVFSDGYWNAAQDYYTHGGQNALDLHENFEPDFTKSGALPARGCRHRRRRPA